MGPPDVTSIIRRYQSNAMLSAYIRLSRRFFTRNLSWTPDHSRPILLSSDKSDQPCAAEGSPDRRGIFFIRQIQSDYCIVFSSLLHETD